MRWKNIAAFVALLVAVSLGAHWWAAGSSQGALLAVLAGFVAMGLLAYRG